jgi:hypothetical protein
MTTRRSAKNKGSKHELLVKDSLKPLWDDIQRYGGEGFAAQFDLSSEKYASLIECKFHAYLGWKELIRYFEKLVRIAAPLGKTPYLIYKTNGQPVLVMYMDGSGITTVQEFASHFGVPFLKERTGGTKRPKVVETIA